MLVRSVHETADLTCDLLCRVGIRLDGFSRQLVAGDDVTDLRELNMVLLGHLEDNLCISKFTTLVDDQSSQFAGLHAEMSASQPHHDFSGALAEKGDLVENGFLLLRQFSGLLDLEFPLELLDSLTLDVKTLRIVCIISNDILVGVCVFCRYAGTSDRTVKRDNLEVIRGKLSEAVVHHVVADCIAVVLLLLDRLAENKVELLDDLDNAVGFNLVSRGRTTNLEHIDFPGIAGQDFAFGALSTSLGKKSKVAELRQRKPEFGVEKLICHQRGFGGNTLLVDGIENVYESGASSLFHDWVLLSVCIEGRVANMTCCLSVPLIQRISPRNQMFLYMESSRKKLKKKKKSRRYKRFLDSFLILIDYNMIDGLSKKDWKAYDENQTSTRNKIQT